MDSRLADWEKRLSEVLKSAITRPYDAENWNCATFAAECVEAVTGRPMPRQLTGTLIETADGLLERVPVKLACRGDVVLMRVPEPALGVCVGRFAAFVGAQGLRQEPMRRAVMAWRV